MSGGKRTAFKDTAYLLTPREAADRAFRRSAAFLRTPTFQKRFPTFPQPRNDGLYHRRAVDAWIDSTFDSVGDGRPSRDERELAMEIAQRGARQSAARQAS